MSCCLTLSWVGNPTAISPTPSASSTEPMPSASSEPSRAAHSATSVPSSSSSDSSEGPGRRRGPSHLLASQRPSAAPEPRNNNVCEDDQSEKIQKLLLGQRAMSLEEDQAQY